MAIYKYNIKKYIKSPSTWIILILTIIMEVVLGGVAPFSLANDWVKRNSDNYAKIAIILITAMTSFLAIFASVFTSFKAATMFKDEIEDGTFLIILSKQVTRKRILMEKWLALQTSTIIYCIATAMTFGITLYLFDIGDEVSKYNELYGMKTLKEKAHIVALYLFLIIFIMSFIFSSLAILISTKFSVGATIGICIGLSVFIPITSLIGAFTHHRTHSVITNKMPDYVKWLINSNKENFKKIKAKDLQNILGSNKLLNKFLKKEEIKKFLDLNVEKINKDMTTLQTDPRSIYDLDMENGQEDTFSNIWFFDLNYQIGILSKFAIDELVNPVIQRLVNKHSGKLGLARSVEKFEVKNKNVVNNHKKIDEMIKFTWEKFSRARLILISSYIYFIKKYEKELNRNQLAKSLINLLWPEQKIVEEEENVENPIKKNKEIPDKFNQVFYKKLLHNFQKYATNQNKMIDWNIEQLRRFSIFFYNIYHVGSMLKSSINEQLKKDINTYLINPIILFPLRSHLDFSSYEKEMGLDHIISSSKKIKTTNGKNGNSTVLKWIDTSSTNAERSKYEKFYDYVINRKSKVARGKYKPYVTKYTLLYSYIIFGLVLLPISYLSIRKRDFR